MNKNKLYILKFFFKKAIKYKKLVILTFLFLPTTVILERYISPLIIAYVLNELQHGSITLEASIPSIVGFFLIQVYSQVIGYRVVLWSMWSVQIKGSSELYRLAYKKLSQHSMGFYSNNFTGSLVSKVNRFTGAYINFWNMVVYKVSFIVVSLVATIVGLSFFMWQFAIVLTVLTIIFTITAYFGTRFMKDRFKERSESYTKISGVLSDSMSNMLAVKADAMELRERNILDGSIDNMVNKEFATRDGFVKLSSAYAFIITLMKTGALVASVVVAQYNLGSAAMVYIALTYTFNLIEEMWNINGLLRDYYQVVGDSEEMLEIINTPASITDTTKSKLIVKDPNINFESVYFSHDSSDKNSTSEILFEDFSLRIPGKQKIGVVGVSGSGKSTLTRLLLRFVEISSGKISIDGQDITKITQKSLRDNIAYVPQEPLLFHRSIRENISYARPDASDKEVLEAAKAANALEFIDTLPDKFDTLVGERGVKLSGGQRQRVAIARALLKNAPILVLDEATSSLDSESEMMIQDALAKLMKNRTSIVIAHRLSTIAKLDRIIVLDSGNIIEDGSHVELIEKDGIYASLWKHQSGGFIQD